MTSEGTGESPTVADDDIMMAVRGFEVSVPVTPKSRPPPVSQPFIPPEAEVTPEPSSGKVEVEFRDLELTVKVVIPGEKCKNCCKPPTYEKILKGVSGKIMPGDIVALMGASGAGKTTLLNVLSRRIKDNSGEVLINGVPADSSKDLQYNSCFVQQEDIFMGHLKVIEHMNYQADLRLPMSKSAKDTRVEDLISQMGLQKTRNNKVGNIAQRAEKGISGGEKKRLSVATEIMTNPALIFADEPTSGLDAFMADAVVTILAGLAMKGRTVISTIHQPSSDVFLRFNKLILLSEGSIIYAGPREAAPAYFAQLDYICPVYANPADFFIETLALDWENPEESSADVERWRLQWDERKIPFIEEWETELKYKLALAAQAAGSPPSLEEPLERVDTEFRIPIDEKNGRPKKVSSCTKWWALTSRCWYQNARDPGVLLLRSIQLIVIGLLLGCVYWRLEYGNWRSKAGVAFCLMLLQGFPATLSVITAFVGQKPIALREKDAHLYNISLFFTAKTSSDFPIQLLIPIIFTSIVWYMTGVNDYWVAFFHGMLTVILTVFAMASYGYFLAALVPRVGLGLALVPAVVIPFVLVCGFVINYESLHPFWYWLMYISPFYYSWSNLMIAIFVIYPSDEELPPFNPEFGSCDAVTTLVPCDGYDVLDMYHIGHDTWHQIFNWIMPVVLTVCWRLIGLLVFNLMNRSSKGA